jgi:hypothetical protein
VSRVALFANETSGFGRAMQFLSPIVRMTRLTVRVEISCPVFASQRLFTPALLNRRFFSLVVINRLSLWRS